ncbi:hypothetical protein PASE110613_03240 [Paenibacillus sediminis]|uniref:Uncharacterized protein n=1 Tax=Paenibacillus sediminis TaxID=664909 RepID=A0ABS4GZ31_9BACL|nr:hypothetical protein [Paenibacillus sediminis]MBP1935397.1 hypothetical protein [Paenibacillus sediminis]
MLDWIFSHIFIVILIVSGLVSLFNRANKTASKSRPSKMPTFGGGGSLSSPDHPRMPQTVQSQTRINDDKPERSITDLLNDLPAPDYSTGEGVSQMWEESKAKVEQPASKMLQSAKPSLDLSSSFRVKDTEEIRKAIIWSEILAPPRAKRHYRNQR